jgi:deazaflavin-dependent oxidoreductase (nitroreductase family)
VQRQHSLQLVTPNRPVKWLLKAPVAVYSAHAGWLLGHRFLLLVHRGRRTARVYRTVLEVVSWDPVTREAVVMSGFGRGSQWYRNVLATDPVEVRIGRSRFTPTARPLGAEEAAAVLAHYEARNRIAAPLLRMVLSRIANFRYDSSPASRQRLVRTLPMVAFRPRD